MSGASNSGSDGDGFRSLEDLLPPKAGGAGHRDMGGGGENAGPENGASQEETKEDERNEAEDGAGVAGMDSDPDQRRNFPAAAATARRRSSFDASSLRPAALAIPEAGSPAGGAAPDQNASHSAPMRRAPLVRAQSVGPSMFSRKNSPQKGSFNEKKKGIFSKFGADYDLPASIPIPAVIPRTTSGVEKKKKETEAVSNLGNALNLLIDVSATGTDVPAPRRRKKKTPSASPGDAHVVPEVVLPADQDVLRADTTPKESEMQRLKTDRSVDVLRKELDTMYDKDKENLLQELWTTYEFLMKKKALVEGEDVEGLILLQKVRMVEISLLGEEEAEKVDEDVQVSRFELSHIENDEIVREMRGEEVSISSSVVGGLAGTTYVEELGQAFTASGMPVRKREEKSTNVMVRRLKRMEKIVATSMRQRLSEMKEMEQDVVRLERELEEKKLALQESKQSVNFFRKDMVRMQITVEDIDSQLRNLTMTYTPVDVKRAGNLGFDMHMDNSVECFIAPKGPVLLVSARMPSQPILRWRVRVSENASWAIGVIPEDEIDNPMYFFTSLRVGVNSKETTRSSLLPRQNLHGLWVEIVVDVKTKHVLIRGEGRLKMEIRQIHDYDVPVRLAVCCFMNCLVEVCTV